jgi:hypothetical protein
MSHDLRAAARTRRAVHRTHEPARRVQRNLRIAPRGATGRDSTVAVAFWRQRGQVVDTVDTTMMLLASADGLGV